MRTAGNMLNLECTYSLSFLQQNSTSEMSGILGSSAPNTGKGAMRVTSRLIVEGGRVNGLFAPKS
jgi:hypothetical protein